MTPADRCIELACSYYNVTRVAMIRPNQSRNASNARSLAAYHLKVTFLMTNEEVAWELERDGSQVSRYLRNVEDLREDKAFDLVLQAQEETLKREFKL